MKSLFTALLLLFALVCQAKRVIERPYFAGSNNHRIEIERVTLDKRATLVDVKIYQFGGEVGIDPRASITADGTTYAYTGSTQLPKGEFVKVPECGYVAATLRFKPMPESTQEFDFREVPDDSGWNIYGVRLDGKRPQTNIPSGLARQTFASASTLPAPGELSTGRTTVRVRLMGYKPEYKTKLSIDLDNWFSPGRMFNDGDDINEDGTCTVTANTIVPTISSIKVNNTRIPFVATPGDTTTITIDLPILTMQATHLFANDSTMRHFAWFEGRHADIDTSLQNMKSLFTIYGDNFFEEICGMTPLQYRDYISQRYSNKQKAIDSDTSLSAATRTLVKANLGMSYALALLGFNNNIALAPMLTGKKGVKRADMTIDTLSFFKELETLPVLHSKDMFYYNDLGNFTRGISRHYLAPDPAIDDIAMGIRLSRKFSRKQPLTEQQTAAANDSINNKEIRMLLFAENQNLTNQIAENDKEVEKAKAEASKSSTYSIMEIPKDMAADRILPAIAEKYKGRKILVDMWNTWCMPCKNAMAAIKPLKEELTDVVYAYIADTSSPDIKWYEMIKGINGTHIRITSEQSEAMNKLYKYNAIPTYFIIDEKGKITYQKTGFPGVDELKKQLQILCKQ